MAANLNLDSIQKLVKSEKEPEQPSLDEKKASMTCQISASDLAKLMVEHWLGFSQCQLNNTVEVNMALCHHLLVAIARHTIRLNRSVVGEACRKALVFTRTGKPLDAVLIVTWAHLVKKEKNRSSAGYQNLHPTEAAVIQEWEKIKESPLGPDSEEPGIAAPAGHADPQPNVVVKEEVKQEKVKEEQQKEATQKLGVPVIVCTDTINMVCTVYLPGAGGVEEVAISAGKSGFMEGLTSGGVRITTTVPNSSAAASSASAVADPEENIAEAPPALEPIPEDPEAEAEEVSAEQDGCEAGLQQSDAVEQTPNAVVQISDASSDESDAESVGTLFSLSAEIGRTPQRCGPGMWGAGQLKMTKDAVAILDIDDDDVPMDHQEEAPAEAEPVNMDVVDVEQAQHQLMSIIHDRTRLIPLLRLRKKTKPCPGVGWKLVYKPGMAPVKKELPEELPGKGHIFWRVMHYKRGNYVALRQTRKPKRQIGSAKIPAGVTLEQAFEVAQRVMDHLAGDESWEAFSSDLLQMGLSRLQ